MTEKDHELIYGMSCVRYALKTDKDWYDSWKANIAMAFYDNYRWHLSTDQVPEWLPEVANKAADYFLQLLIEEKGAQK